MSVVEELAVVAIYLTIGGSLRNSRQARLVN